MANSFRSSRLYGFFCELKRRKLYRVAVGYSVVGWLIIQFATTVLPALTLPAWTVRLVIVLDLAGFPIALILAWALEAAGFKNIEVTVVSREKQSPFPDRFCYRGEIACTQPARGRFIHSSAKKAAASTLFAPRGTIP